MASIYETNINATGLSIKTINALERSGIHTLQDLLVASEFDLKSIRGLGEHGVAEIEAVFEKYNELTDNDFVEDPISFGNILDGTSMDERKKEILIEYYNSQPKITLQVIGDRHGISKERVRQILVKGTKVLNKTYNNGAIDQAILSAIDEAAEARTEVNMLNIKDPYFTGTGIAFLVSSFTPKKYKILKSPSINGEWLVKKEDNVEEILSLLIAKLKNDPYPTQISKIKNVYSIDENLLLSIKDIIEKDGYVTHKSNKIVTGKDRFAVVSNYLKTIHRPATIQEIYENTNLTENQVRSATADRHRYVNVGKSMYDLVEEEYGDLSIEDLAKNYLTAEGNAVKIDTLINYIQKYKSETTETIFLQLIKSQEIRKYDNFFLLKNWSDDRIVVTKRNNYELNLEDVVFEIINASNDIFTNEKVYKVITEKYKDKVSNNINSINAMLVRLANKNLINRIDAGCYTKKDDLPKEYANKKASEIIVESSLSRFINAHIGGYIEIRYKTDRPDSEFYWRKISISGQDHNYIYTFDLDSHYNKIYYKKENVVEYRDVQSTTSATINIEEGEWLNDVLLCINQIESDNFTLSDVYKFENALKQKHPTNNNITAKIRQQLQILRDKGLIEFLGDGKYRKH